MVNYQKLVQIGRELLVAIGEDPDREELKETPRRFASFARIVNQFAHRPLIRERFVHQVADGIYQAAKTDNVIVLVVGEHLCRSCRGTTASLCSP